MTLSAGLKPRGYNEKGVSRPSKPEKHFWMRSYEAVREWVLCLVLSPSVIPAKAGIQDFREPMDSRLRGSDGLRSSRTRF
jgi:hypothetical protein